jgi:type IV secretion system protein VirB8
MNKEAESYFAEASRWEFDRTAALTRAARRAWVVAIAAAAAAVLATGAILLLTPLKQVEPFVVRVDSSSGIVDVVPGYAGNAELPDIVTRHLVTQYVTQRERYVPAIAEVDYEQIGAYHSAAMNQAWAAAWARSNPDSPLVRYADGTHVRAQVQSVSFLKHVRGSPDLLQVRFLSATRHGSGASEELSHFVATLQVTYGAPSTDVRLRALNPLGFKVLEYRREPEVVEAMAAAVPAMLGSATSATGGSP